MKTQAEVEKAHDMIAGILDGQIPQIVLDPEVREVMIASLDVLCWILDHENDTFSLNLADLEEAAAQLGYGLGNRPPGDPRLN